MQPRTKLAAVMVQGGTGEGAGGTRAPKGEEAEVPDLGRPPGLLQAWGSHQRGLLSAVAKLHHEEKTLRGFGRMGRGGPSPYAPAPPWPAKSSSWPRHRARGPVELPLREASGCGAGVGTSVGILLAGAGQVWASGLQVRGKCGHLCLQALAGLSPPYPGAGLLLSLLQPPTVQPQPRAPRPLLLACQL